MNLLNETAVAPAAKVVDYGRKLEAAIQAIQADIAAYPAIQQQYPARWLAIKLLEQDHDLQTRLLAIEGGPALLTKTQLAYARLAADYGEEIDVLIADRRYTYIHELVGRVMQKPPETLSLTDKIDRLVTHRLLGVPIFMAVMWVVFKLTAVVSAPLLDWVDGVVSGPITHWAAALLAWVGLGGSWIEALALDGVIAGVGGVLVFVPVLMFLYVSLAVLEDTGYMARAAFVMDGLMNRIGLQGKSFLPMMVGFGCTVPAIYATRTLENEKDRILTGLLVPFMSCGARLPVYVLFATVFFSAYAGAVVFRVRSQTTFDKNEPLWLDRLPNSKVINGQTLSMYVLGIITAVLLGLLLRKTLFKDKEQTALLMELPPYRRPNWRTIWSHTWERTRSFIQNAWSLILITSVILWLLMAIPVGAEGGSFADTDVDHSLFSSVAGAISPALEPLGFGTWEAGGALISGFVAKEVVVSTFSQVYGLQDSGATAVPTTFWQDMGEIVTGFGTAVLDTIKAIPLIVGIDVRGESSETVPGGLRQAVYEGFDASSGGHAALAGLAF
ncbi:MAG: ferrous iron transporter B, partial [Candidatus Promineifilaceae bacterium]